jgi:hypothetical protein
MGVRNWLSGVVMAVVAACIIFTALGWKRGCCSDRVVGVVGLWCVMLVGGGGTSGKGLPSWQH